MTQAPIFGVPRSGPASPDIFASRTDDSLDALLSAHSGSARPTYAVAGTLWLSTATAGKLKKYLVDGTNDRLFETIDIATGAITYEGGAFSGDINLSGNKITNVASLNGGPLSGFRNKLINPRFAINQRGAVNGAFSAGVYGWDRWKADTGGCNPSLSGVVMTINSGALVQVIEGANIEVTGNHCLSWVGTATAQINGSSVANGASVSLAAGSNVTVRFTGGTVSYPQLEFGTQPTAFEQRATQELALCQRYYEKVTVFAVSYNSSGTAAQRAMGTFRATKRTTTPTVGSIAVRSGVLTTPASTDVTGDAVWVAFSSTGASQEGSFIVPIDGEL